MSSVVHANLKNLADPAHKVAAERYEGFQAGGGGMVLKEEVIFKDSDCFWNGNSLEITFTASGGSIEATSHAMDLPNSWKGFGRLRMVARDGNGVRVELVVVGARCRLIDGRDSIRGETHNFDLDLRDLPLAAGIRPLYEPTGVRVVAYWSDEEPSKTICLDDISLVPAETEKPLPCVDRFGQRASTTWPGKITGEDQLRRNVELEAQTLSKINPPAERDEFGGWTKGPKFEPGGFFRAEKDSDGRWWFVDPLGNPFWSIGTTGVRTTDVTPVAGREFLFEQLPDRSGPHARAWLFEDALSFYRWNVLRKYGSLDAWKHRVLERFRRWGFNTIANWSEPLMLDQTVVPHVRNIRTHEKGSSTPMATKSFGDVFDPRWETYVESQIAEVAAPARENPWLLGYFVDNEAPWKRMKLLSSESGVTLRDEWLKFVQRECGTVEAFSAVWGSPVASWAQVRELRDTDVPEEGPAREFMQRFETHYARTYFGIIRRLLKKYDSNHMYMGCRFVRSLPHEGIIRAVGDHADVVSINCYAMYPKEADFNPWYEITGKPLLIGEHHTPLWSQRQLLPLYPAFTPQQRYDGYVRYLSTWASWRYTVGCHWFQHADQPLTGRSADGEDQLIGFVDITDNPHEHMVDAARHVTANIYPWHSESK
jgi:hypothetical protein